MFNEFFEYDIGLIDAKLLETIVKSIEKDLKSQGIFECSINYNSIFFKGKGTVNNVHPFNSIDYCEIIIDLKNGLLKYEITYSNLFVSAIIYMLISVLSIIFFEFNLLLLFVAPFFLLFFYLLSLNIKNTHASYAESLVGLIDELVNESVSSPASPSMSK